MPEYNKGQSKLAKYLFKFSKKYNLKVVIAGKGEAGSDYRRKEIEWFKNNLNGQKFDLRARNDNTLSNYQLMLQSKIIVALRASLAREAIGYNKKAFFCNFTNHKDAEFPFFHKINKVCLNQHSYELFEKKLLYVFKVSNKKYFDYLGKIKNEIIANSKGYDDFIKKRISEIINL